jgi:hypothetical protein
VSSDDLIYANAKALRVSGDPQTTHWCGDSIKWSAECGGCLMWTRAGRDWSSQDEGEYLTPADAESALAWYAERGVLVDWLSLESCDVVDVGRP